MPDYQHINKRCICPICGHVSKWTDCDKVHINCERCREQPKRITPCNHLGEVIRTTNINKCRKKIPIHSCKLYGDVTTDCEIPLTPCCRTCGEYEAGESVATHNAGGDGGTALQ